MNGRVHVIGAGLAGLSASMELSRRGARVVLSEMAGQAGGRCRSFRDEKLGLTIDNGNHLVLSGNEAVARYVNLVGSQDALEGPEQAAFDYLDVANGQRWTLRPSEGRWPWWILDRRRRVPGTRLTEYLALATLARPHPGRRIDEVISCEGPLWDNCLRPLFTSALHTAPEGASADLAGAVIRETLAKGGRYTRPLMTIPTLAAAFIEPALHRLQRSTADVRLGRTLRAVGFDGSRVSRLSFDDGDDEVVADDRVIVAVPPWAAQKLLPGITAPDSFHAIVNAHFRRAPAPDARPMVGLVGATADWIFAFANRYSVTVSAADHLVDQEAEALTELLWRDVCAAYDLSGPPPPCRILKEKRATFAATPEQEARRPCARTAWSNLFRAGDWTATGLPATIEGALRSGESAAALALGTMT